MGEIFFQILEDFFGDLNRFCWLFLEGFNLNTCCSEDLCSATTFYVNNTGPKRFSEGIVQWVHHDLI